MIHNKNLFLFIRYVAIKWTFMITYYITCLYMSTFNAILSGFYPQCKVYKYQ